ncbi:putative cytochrome P450 [Lyophyllum shimeji]|uniref:Cytochrome P450 n=1 Tax=Lyophyllum shimeji TaxID=47721 RepID=A0A9P3PT14_LYOSH|nr:putative cytochrome P450 [Lyophyllum shimeji]
MVHGLFDFLSSLYVNSSVQIRFLGHEISLFSAVVAVFIASRVFKLIHGINALNHLPGMRVPFQPLAAPGAILPTTRWNPGLRFPWLWRFTFYKRYQSENVSIVPFISGVPGIYTSNLDVARQVAAGGHKSSFVKPESASQALLLWGMNLVAADGDMWRKHRRIMGPAFNNKLYQMVWTETLETYREMIAAEGWSKKDLINVPVVQTLTFKLALLIIGKCGFGFSFNWTAPPTAPDGTMSVQEALRIVADSHMLAIFAPKWLLALPFRRLREIGEAHDQLMGFMRSQVANRKAEISAHESTKNDAFTMLVKANEEESTKLQLDDQELIGNVFIMLFAGHETTAHTLAATLGFLGLYQDMQQETVEQIVSVVGWDRDPVFEDYAKLDKVLAVFYEALRMFPAGHILIREATEDTVLQIPNPPGQEGTTPFPVPKGVQVMVDMVGVQYNPRYFDEPEKYKPSRWYGISNESEAFSAFSIGPRACIGRRFATTEAVAFLTMLLRDWEVEPILKQGETKEQGVRCAPEVYKEGEGKGMTNFFYAILPLDGQVEGGARRRTSLHTLPVRGLHVKSGRRFLLPHPSLRTLLGEYHDYLHLLGAPVLGSHDADAHRTSDNVDELNETRDLQGELGPVRHGFHNPFSKLTGPVKHAMSPTISRGKSYARRVSVPTRRLTGHLAAAISHPFHHRRRSLDPAICSYFATHDIGPLDVVKEEKVEVEVEVEGVGVEQDVTVLDSHGSKPAAPGKPTKFKRVVTKAKAILRIRRRRL